MEIISFAYAQLILQLKGEMYPQTDSNLIHPGYVLTQRPCKRVFDVLVLYKITRLQNDLA